jgi:hypothetical protein
MILMAKPVSIALCPLKSLDKIFVFIYLYINLPSKIKENILLKINKSEIPL